MIVLSRENVKGLFFYVGMGYVMFFFFYEDDDVEIMLVFNI